MSDTEEKNEGSVSDRMLKLLETSNPSTAYNGISDAKDVYSRAAYLLAVGLHRDLPDDPAAASDYLVDILTKLLREKRSAISKAVSTMCRSGASHQAKQLLKKLEQEY